MEDKYVGDIGDFGKYALLRALAHDDVVLGIVWYLTEFKNKSQDGKFVQYLSSQEGAKKLGECDLKLFAALRKIVESKDRRVARIREDGIFSKETVFYDELLDFANVSRQSRPEKRAGWFQKALTCVEKTHLVFLDPDNGIALDERKKHWNIGPKYVFLDEVKGYLRRRKNLILYCHQDRRKGGLDEQVREGIELLSKESPIRETWAFTFHRQSVRIYFVVPCDQQMATLLAARSKAFISEDFGIRDHFRLTGLPEKY
jgi:hypothetical protein